MEERLGDRIRALRKHAGMPAAELARRVALSRNQLYMIESNKTPDPGAFTVLALAKEFGVTTDYLLTGKRTSPKRPRPRTTAPVG